MSKRKSISTWVSDDKKLFGLTFYSDWQHLDNSWWYEIFVAVPENHQEEKGRTYQDFDGIRTVKIAGEGHHASSAMAFQAMMIKVGELLAKIRKE